MIGDSSMVNFRRQGDRTVKLDFTEKTGGRGVIHIYYAGKFVKTIQLNLKKEPISHSYRKEVK